MTYNFKLPEKSAHWAAIGAFISGIFVHLFGIVTVLHNYDSIYNAFDNYGSSVASGRWFLKILGDFTEKAFGGSYNLSWFNSVIFILFLAFSAYFLTDIFEIQSRKSAVMIGVAFVTFPTVVSTLLFKYTSTYYGVGILLAVLAVWSMVRYKYGFVLTVLFTAFSLGIYQAYFPLTVSIFVVYLLKKTLTGQNSVKELFFQGVICCVSMFGGLALYFFLMSLSLDYYDISLSTYQNIDQMGNISLLEIPSKILKAFSSFFTAPIKYDDRYRLALTSLLQTAYLLTLIVSIVIVICAVIRLKKVSTVLLATFLCFMFPIAVNLIVVMSSEWIYTLMVYPFVMVMILPVVLLETLEPVSNREKNGKKFLDRAITTVLLTIILCNAYFADFNYTSLYYANRQTENYVSALVAQIRMTNGFSAEKKWALIGTVSDPLLSNEWMIQAPYMKFGGNATSEQLLSAYSMDKWIEFYVGYTVPVVSDEVISSLKEIDEVKNMPCWPDAGSIQIIDDIVVVKLEQ